MITRLAKWWLRRVGILMPEPEPHVTDADLHERNLRSLFGDFLARHNEASNHHPFLDGVHELEI